MILSCKPVPAGRFRRFVQAHSVGRTTPNKVAILWLNCSGICPISSKHAWPLIRKPCAACVVLLPFVHCAIFHRLPWSEGLYRTAPPLRADKRYTLPRFIHEGRHGAVVAERWRQPTIHEMLKALNLRQYRGFESYQLADLARVNLLVGKNNVGKTSIIEAVELLLSGGSVHALSESVRRRNEFGRGMRHALDISHIFHGHQCTPGACFDLSGSRNRPRLRGKIVALEEVDKTEMRVWQPWIHHPDEESEAGFGLRLFLDGQPPIVLPVAENGLLISGPWARSQGNGHVNFLNLNLSSMQSAWNAIVEARLEEEIFKAMHILMPTIDSIHFLVGDRQEGILIGREGAALRLPIGSYGDGMRRLLAISLALVGTQNGCLLIDEIDTGLHWTVMEDMWRLVVEAAQRYSVQVFATTHSYDCIRGLGSLIQSRPDLSELVAIQKVHRSLEKAVCIPGEDIPIVAEQDIEVR